MRFQAWCGSTRTLSTEISLASKSVRGRKGGARHALISALRGQTSTRNSRTCGAVSQLRDIVDQLHEAWRSAGRETSKAPRHWKKCGPEVRRRRCVEVK